MPKYIIEAVDKRGKKKILAYDDKRAKESGTIDLGRMQFSMGYPAHPVTFAQQGVAQVFAKHVHPMHGRIVVTKLGV